LSVDEFGKVIVSPEFGGVGPQLKMSACPGKFGMTIPTGKPIVRISVSVAVFGGQTAALLVAVIVTGNVPTALAVPEISPGVQPSLLLWQTVNPPGKPNASKAFGLLSAVIW
jgi:hypothetical protein